MAGRLEFKIFIRKVHFYSSFAMTGSFLMYIITGFLMTRHDMWPPVKEITAKAEYPVSLPDSISDADLPSFLQEKFMLEGYRGKTQANRNGSRTIMFSKPGKRHQVIVSPDNKTVRINTTEMNLRSVITAFHRVKEYGGGFLYDIYVLISDLTAISILIFGISGLLLSFSGRKNLLPKILVLSAGIIYTLSVIFSFMNA